MRRLKRDAGRLQKSVDGDSEQNGRIGAVEQKAKAPDAATDADSESSRSGHGSRGTDVSIT